MKIQRFIKRYAQAIMIIALVFSVLYLAHSLGVFTNYTTEEVNTIKMQQLDTNIKYQSAMDKVEEYKAAQERLVKALDEERKQSLKEYNELRTKYEKITGELDSVNTALPQRPTI